MKLLLDASISRRILPHIVDVYAGSEHASCLGPNPEDIEIWRHATRNGFTIVTKDGDFYAMSLAWGHPPKVIWLRVGNGDTQVIVNVLRGNVAALSVFIADKQSSLIELGTSVP